MKAEPMTKNRLVGAAMIVASFEAVMVILSLIAMNKEPKFPFWIEIVAHNIFFLFLVGLVSMFFKGIDKWEDR